MTAAVNLFFFFPTGSHPSKYSVWSKFKLLNLATIIKQRSHILLTALVLLVLLILVWFWGFWGWGRAFCYISETTIQTSQLIKEYKSIFTWELCTKIYDGWTPHSHQHSILPKKLLCSTVLQTFYELIILCKQKDALSFFITTFELSSSKLVTWMCSINTVVSTPVINWRYRK